MVVGLFSLPSHFHWMKLHSLAQIITWLLGHSHSLSENYNCFEKWKLHSLSKLLPVSWDTATCSVIFIIITASPSSLFEWKLHSLAQIITCLRSLTVQSFVATCSLLTQDMTAVQIRCFILGPSLMYTLYSKAKVCAIFLDMIKSQATENICCEKTFSVTVQN